MKIKTQDLTGAALDLAVVRAGYGYDFKLPLLFFNPSTDWSQGGPIIEREMVELYKDLSRWTAVIRVDDEEPWELYGPTPLIAAMRCYVASKLGEEVDIPEELV